MKNLENLFDQVETISRKGSSADTEEKLHHEISELLK
jgi:hypothetical protein